MQPGCCCEFDLEHERFNADGFEHRDELYKGEADDSGGVAALDIAEQGDAEGFDLEGASAVEGEFAAHIMVDFVGGEGAERQVVAFGTTLEVLGGCIEDGQGGGEDVGATGEASELGAGGGLGAGFAQQLAVGDEALVGADDEGVGEGGG